eukprot:13214-Eustigmatos_ZCMA.PRE.1
MHGRPLLFLVNCASPAYSCCAVSLCPALALVSLCVCMAGTPLVYELDERLKPIPHPQAIAPLSGYYLGDQDAIRRRIEGVKAQT